MAKTLIVAGMHRSGTSLLAKGLDTQIPMGPRDAPKQFLNVPAPDNPLGHYEDLRFVTLNDKILGAAGGSWYRPPDNNALEAVYGGFISEAKHLIKIRNEEADGGLWGFKDPRTTLTLPFWHNLVESPHVVSVFRNPHDVAVSLMKRNPDIFKNLSDALRLVDYYNITLLDHLDHII